MPWFDKHAKARSRFGAFVDRELSGRELGEVNAHIETCEPCAIELDQLIQMRDALRTTPEATPRRSFALTPDMVAAPSKPVPPEPLPKLQVGMRLASAALALALVVVFVADNGLGGSDEGSDDSTDSRDEAAAGGGEMQADELAPSAEESLNLTGDDSGEDAGGTGSGADGDAAPEPTADAVAPEDTEAQFAEPPATEDNGSMRSETDPISETTPEAEAPLPDSDNGESASSGNSQATSESDDGGANTALVLEIVLLIALIGTVGATIFLAVRSRNARAGNF